MAKEKKQKKKRFGGRLLSTAIVVLCIGGVCMIAYPFVLTGVIEHNKDAVVRQLEAELPIYRDPEDFSPVDIDAMQVVDTPTWTAEEKAQAGNPMGVWETLIGEDTRTAIASALGGGNQEKTVTVNLPMGALPTLIPQALQSGNEFATLAPQAEAEDTDGPTRAPSRTPDPADTGAAAGTNAPAETLQGTVTVAEATNPPVSVGEVVSGPQVAASARETADPAAVEAPETSEAPAATEEPVLAQSQPGDPGAAVQPAAATVPTQEERNLEEERQQAIAEILRDEAPVYYEDFSESMASAEGLYASMNELSTSLARKRQVEIPGEVRMTFQGIQSQFLAMQSLFTVVDDLPSANQAYATFPLRDGSGERQVLIYDGVGELYDTLKQLSRAHVTVQTVALYPDAAEDVQLALDEIVLVGDQLQNVLDYMSKYLSDVDSDLYLRYRASSMVGETEALYLLEIPSINLKVGCFQDLTFEQMYKSMRKGAALFPRVGTPNTNTNISMSAHRTGSAAFFKDFDQIQNGDEILLHTRTLGSFRYLVDGTAVIEKDDWTTTFSVGYPALTLVSCEEFEGISNSKRIVVRGRLVGIAKK